jgi:hypothetical protein
MYDSECCLHHKKKGKGEMLRPNPTTIPSYVSLYTHMHIIRASVNHRSSVISYSIMLQSSVRSWTQDLVQGYRWVKWASTVNQATVVYLSLVGTVQWRLSATRRAYTHVSKNCRRRRISKQRYVIYRETPTGCTLFSLLLPTFPGVEGGGIPEIKVTYIEVHFYLLKHTL